MIVAAALAIAGAVAAPGTSRGHEAGEAKKEAEPAAASRAGLDPAAPDCPSAIVVQPRSYSAG